ncbi:MAG: hypothetical protein DRI56_01415 [Chloroflexota bacterium]|nr:MAG: hypothetical protein DRI56_01415 [Chloroflexota bacterium]
MIITLQFIGVLAGLILLHEIGHFIAARIFGVEVEEFGIGFPPKMLTLFKMGGTEYTLNWLPFGGFVRPKGEGDPDVPGGLAAAKPMVRIAVFLAGPFMNLLIAVIVYSIIFSQTGVPDWNTVEILAVDSNSPAEAAGLQAGDIVEYINDVTIDSDEALRDEVYANLEQTISIVYQRDGEEGEVSLVPRQNPPEGEGAIGIIMSNPMRKIGWFQALPMGAVATYHHCVAVLTIPAQLLRGTQGASRPVGFKGMHEIYQVATSQELIPEASVSVNILAFVVSVTVSLGILNLLPIPALDGGRILFALPELIFKRRISQRVQNITNSVSFVILIALLFYINILDFINPVSLP